MATFPTTLRFEQSVDESKEIVLEAMQRTKNLVNIERGGYHLKASYGTSKRRVDEEVLAEFSDPSPEGVVDVVLWSEESGMFKFIRTNGNYKRLVLSHVKVVRNEYEMEQACESENQNT